MDCYNKSAEEILNDLNNKYKYDEKKFIGKEYFYVEILEDLDCRFIYSCLDVEKKFKTHEPKIKDKNKMNEYNDLLSEYKKLERQAIDKFIYIRTTLCTLRINYIQSEHGHPDVDITFKRVCQNVIQDIINYYIKKEKELIIISEKIDNLII